ncbi:MAG: hypothetical protein GWP67_06225 [Gammaproteobacteria bacterium]|jgi:hypothetical protein|nr:hypothetical protein [Gammaproteobacteria bacterium]
MSDYKLIFGAPSMRIRTTLFAVLLGLSFSVSAENYIISQAYEIALDELRLPGNTVGSVSFKDCNACDTQTIRVTVQTRYVVNNRDVTLVEFTQEVSTIADKKSNIATVIHHLESDSIVALQIVK